MSLLLRRFERSTPSQESADCEPHPVARPPTVLPGTRPLLDEILVVDADWVGR